jgi:hemerythrin-like metal-binding protein
MEELNMINQLVDAMRRGQGAAAVRSTLAGLMEHFRTHFADEEDLMRRTDYPDLATHQEEHGQYMARLESLKTNIEKTGETDAVTLLFILRDEILQHILQTDKAYSAHISANGIHT